MDAFYHFDGRVLGKLSRTPFAGEHDAQASGPSRHTAFPSTFADMLRTYRSLTNNKQSLVVV
jgi:hypothetical protein